MNFTKYLGKRTLKEITYALELFKEKNPWAGREDRLSYGNGLVLLLTSLAVYCLDITPTPEKIQLTRDIDEVIRYTANTHASETYYEWIKSLGNKKTSLR